MDISAVLRIMAFVVLLISLIVMVTDKTRSDELLSVIDNSTALQYSFNDFEAFRFVVAANVTGFVYSFIRIILGFRSTIKVFHLYLSFILDQVMAYLLLSSASAGIAYIMFIRDSFEGQEAYGAGEKKFLRYASASVSMEFLGFLVMAASAVMSTYNLLGYMRCPKLFSMPSQEIPAVNNDTRQHYSVHPQGVPDPNIYTRQQDYVHPHEGVYAPNIDTRHQQAATVGLELVVHE